MLITGDLGGTKTHLAIFSAEKGPHQTLFEAKFASGDYATFEGLVHEFLSQTTLSAEITDGCFGVAGPVVEGRAKITNLPWTLDERELAKALDLEEVKLLNDLEAIANGIPLLEAKDLYTLNIGAPEPNGPFAVIAPGTGLGEGFATWDPEADRYQAHDSEGGHTDFAPVNETQRALLAYLQERKGYEHVSYERICSGMGLPNIYAFYRDVEGLEEPEGLAKELAVVTDPTPLIVNRALDERTDCELCTRTLGLFVDIMGAEAGNLALKVLATGGVYVAGGIPPRILKVLATGRFIQAFTAKGRMSTLVSRMPVHVILHPRVALLGATAYGFRLKQ